MKIGILGAGNIGRTLKAMLASVEGVSRATVADGPARRRSGSTPRPETGWGRSSPATTRS